MTDCKIDCKKLLKLSAIAFVVFMITDFIIHGKILEELYRQTTSLWRTEDEMKSMMMYMWGGHIIVALYFAWIFMHGYKGGGVGEGVRYGLLIGGFQAGGALIMHAVCPYPAVLTVAWIVLGFIQYAICGAAIAKFAK